jgi:hypothetical protein
LPLPSTSTVPTPATDAVLNEVPGAEDDEGDDVVVGLPAAVVVVTEPAVVVEVVPDALLFPDELHAASTNAPDAATSSALRTTMSNTSVTGLRRSQHRTNVFRLFLYLRPGRPHGSRTTHLG